MSKIRQGPDEKYSDFVARLLQAVGRIVTDVEAGTIIVKQLAYENANSACQAAIRPWRKTGTLEDYVRLCAEIGPSYVQGLTLAAALRGISPQQMQQQMLKQGTRGGRRGQKIFTGAQICFNCGKPGHFKSQCPQLKAGFGNSVSPQQVDKPLSLCPRCQRGFHWANECRSKTDRFGNPLSGNQGRVLSQPRQTIAMLTPVQDPLN